MRTRIITSLFMVVMTASAMAYTTSCQVANAFGCGITIKADNNGTKHLKIDLSESQVRIKAIVAGPWSRLANNCHAEELLVNPGQQNASVACTMDFGCGSQRQWKFKIVEINTSTGAIINTVWHYFPSSSGWSSVTTVDLGNIGRLF